LSGFQSVFQIILDEIFEFGAGNHSVHMSEHKAFRHLVLGNLGLLSTASTLIVSFVGAIAIYLAVMLNKTVHRISCTLVGYVLLKTTSLGQRRFQRLL
jgi:hypothetical protein